MVNVMCQTKDELTLGELTPFQGDLKRRTSKDVQELANSITNEGLLMPFAVWRHEGKNNLLDGHGRLAALTELAMRDDDVATQKFPVLYVDAESEEQAKKSLLQITSSYGRVTKKGVLEFCKAIPEYKAPVVNKYVHRKQGVRKFEENRNEELIRIAVPSDKARAVRDLLKTVDYIRVL